MDGEREGQDLGEECVFKRHRAVGPYKTGLLKFIMQGHGEALRQKAGFTGELTGNPVIESTCELCTNKGALLP